MKLYACNLAPNLDIGFEKKHSGYWVIFEGSEEECYFIIFNFDKKQHRYFYGGGHGNVDRDFVRKEIERLNIEWNKKVNENEKIWKQMQKRILEIKIKKLEIELEKEELQMLKEIKKFYLNKIFSE
jgi:hypothetical protein